MEIRVLRGGMQTTVQDLGRRGHRGSGVPWSGAMDGFALRIANALVGNPDDAAGLEMTLVGAELEFSEDALIATAGAESAGCPAWAPVAVRAGERIKFGECRGGCRTYLAVAGGIAVAPVLGSRSTYLRGGFGGLAGRALREGDVLAVGAAPAGRWSSVRANWRIDRRFLPAYSPTPKVRVVRGAQAAEFGPDFWEQQFQIATQSDRMAVRLEGVKLTRSTTEELLSTAVLPGTVQVPPDGRPLVLMADAQTIGGYPQLGQVITVDLPLVAQLRPGDGVFFVEASVEDAQRLARARERGLGMLREGLAQKLISAS